MNVFFVVPEVGRTLRGRLCIVWRDSCIRPSRLKKTICTQRKESFNQNAVTKAYSSITIMDKEIN